MRKFHVPLPSVSKKFKLRILLNHLWPQQTPLQTKLRICKAAVKLHALNTSPHWKHPLCNFDSNNELQCRTAQCPRAPGPPSSQSSVWPPRSIVRQHDYVALGGCSEGWPPDLNQATWTGVSRSTPSRHETQAVSKVTTWKFGKLYVDVPQKNPLSQNDWFWLLKKCNAVIQENKPSVELIFM